MAKTDNVPKTPYVGAKIDKVLDGNGATKAFATVSIANTFMVHNVRVVEGSKGLFVSMPNQQYTDRNGNQKYSDICHATTAEMKQRIDLMVLNAYNQAIGNVQGLTEAQEKLFEEIEAVDLEEGLPFDYVPTNVEAPTNSMSESNSEVDQDEGLHLDFLPGYSV